VSPPGARAPADAGPFASGERLVPLEVEAPDDASSSGAEAPALAALPPALAMISGCFWLEFFLSPLQAIPPSATAKRRTRASVLCGILGRAVRSIVMLA